MIDATRLSSLSVVIVASVVSTIALGVIPSFVCWLKGKRRWAVIGFFSAWHLVAAYRLAKPDSWWARRFYDDAKRRRASERFAGGAHATASSATEGGAARESRTDDAVVVRSDPTGRGGRSS